MNKKEELGKKKNYGKLIFFLLITAVLVLALLFAAKSIGDLTSGGTDNNSPEVSTSLKPGEGFPYRIEPNSVKDIALCDGSLLLLKNDSTVLLSSTANEMSVLSHDLLNPVMRINGNHIILFDLDSGRFKIRTGNIEKKSYELSDKIITGAIGEKGNYAVAAYDSDVASKFIAYSETNDEIYKWNFKNEYVSDIALSDNGNSAVVSTVFSAEGELSSKIYVFSFKQKKPENVFDFPSSAIVRIYFVNDNVVAYGDNVRAFLKKGKEKTDVQNLGADKINGICVAPDGKNLLSVSKYGSSSLSEIKLFGPGNKPLSEPLELDRNVRHVDCDGKHTAVLSENEILVYNNRAKLVGSAKADGSPKKVLLSGNSVFAVTASEVLCLKFK